MQCVVFIIFLLYFHVGASAQDFHEVERVIDGDTFVIVGGERIRLIGIDTPETVHPDEPPEPFGEEASDWLKTLLDGRRVSLELDVQERDRYGRLLAYVYLEDGTFVNALLLREGLAMILTVPPNVKYAEEFLKIQQQARENRRGLWRENR